MRLLIELAFGRCGCRTCRVDRLAWRWHMAHAVPGAYVLSFAPLPPVCRHPTPVRFCRECGCWELEACLDGDGVPCHWIEPDLCSACGFRHAAAPASMPEGRSASSPGMPGRPAPQRERPAPREGAR